MTDAQQRQALLLRVEQLLVSVGPLLEYSPAHYNEAAAIVGSIVNGQPIAPGPDAERLYADAIAATRPARRRLPQHAVGQFPFNRPTPLLRDRQAQLDAMLAPLSDCRRRAAGLPRRRKDDTNGAT